MKKLMVYVSVLAVCMLAIQACGQIKTLPTWVLELAEGTDDCADNVTLGPPYTACFSFENGLVNNLQNSGAGAAGITALSNSSDRAFRGTKSLKLDCNFTGTNDLATGKGTVLRSYGPSTSVDMTGRTITVRIWVPANMFDSSMPYGATIFVQDSTWKWYDNVWQNLEMPSGNVPGKWNTFQAYVGDLKADNKTLTMTATASSQIYLWGVQISKGGNSVTGSADYNGPIYLDSLTIE